MYKRKLESDIRCPLEYGISIMSGKWKSRIVCMIGNRKPLRYGEIKSKLMTITDGVLAATLNELIDMGVLVKNEDSSKGVFEYDLTAKGRSLIPVLQGMCQWAGQYYSESSEVVMSQCLDCEFYRKWKYGDRGEGA